MLIVLKGSRHPVFLCEDSTFRKTHRRTCFHSVQLYLKAVESQRVERVSRAPAGTDSLPGYSEEMITSPLFSGRRDI